MLNHSLLEISQKLKHSVIQPSTLCALALKRIKLISQLNAFITIRQDLTSSQALQSDVRQAANTRLSPLDGIPVAFKDNFCTKDWKTSCGSFMLDNFVAPYDATVVSRSLNGGAVIVGKTNMDEFAMGSGTLDSYVGPTKNLWRSGIRYKLVTSGGTEVDADTSPLEDDWVIAGGSSGGSAVAVLSGAAFASLGSDTGGSVRIPAGWTGVVSLKPSYGGLSRHGLIPLVNSLDVPGVFVKKVEDLAIYLKLLEGHDPLDSTSSNGDFSLEAGFKPEGIRVGIPSEYHCSGMSGEVVEAWSRVADLLESAGAVVVPVSLPHTSLAIPCYSVINPTEVASNMSRYDGLQYGLRGEDESSTEAMYAASRSKGFNSVVRGRILAGNYFLLKKHYSDYFLNALKIRRMIQNDFISAFHDVDVLLTPVSLTDAPSYKDFSSVDNRTQTATQDFCTQPVNLAGLPALTLPVSLSKRSLPLSIQLIGQFRRDADIINLAKWLERELDFPQLQVLEDQS